MGGDLARVCGFGRAGQVVAEGNVDPVAGRPGADHDQAAVGVEAEQVGHGREDLGGRADADRGRRRVGRVGLMPAGFGSRLAGAA